MFRYALWTPGVQYVEQQACQISFSYAPYLPVSGGDSVPKVPYYISLPGVIEVRCDSEHTESLVQVMACCFVGASQLSQLMLTYLFYQMIIQ